MMEAQRDTRLAIEEDILDVDLLTGHNGHHLTIESLKGFMEARSRALARNQFLRLLDLCVCACCSESLDQTTTTVDASHLPMCRCYVCPQLELLHPKFKQSPFEPGAQSSAGMLAAIRDRVGSGGLWPASSNPEMLLAVIRYMERMRRTTVGMRLIVVRGLQRARLEQTKALACFDAARQRVFRGLADGRKGGVRTARQRVAAPRLDAEGGEGLLGNGESNLGMPEESGQGACGSGREGAPPWASPLGGSNDVGWVDDKDMAEENGRSVRDERDEDGEGDYSDGGEGLEGWQEEEDDDEEPESLEEILKRMSEGDDDDAVADGGDYMIE